VVRLYVMIDRSLKIQAFPLLSFLLLLILMSFNTVISFHVIGEAICKYTTVLFNLALIFFFHRYSLVLRRVG
jgi:hypothetical protein